MLVRMRIVVAPGGNALLPRGVDLTMARQGRLAVTHGSGQVALLAMRAAAYEAGSDIMLDRLDAGSAGMAGYAIEQALGNRLPPNLSVVSRAVRASS